MVVGPETGARHRSMHYLQLLPGTATEPLRHEGQECVYYVASGDGEIEEVETGETVEIHRGSMMLVPPSVGYVIWSSGGEELVVVGGPCSAPVLVATPVS